MSNVGGVGGGSIMGQLDVQGLVEQIIYAKQQPIRDLEVYENFFEAKRTALQDLNTKVTGVESAMYNLNSSGFDSKTTSLSRSDYLSATASSTASEGSYDIIVERLAKSRSYSSDDGKANATDKLLNEGIFTITDKDANVHTWDFTDPSDNKSLNDLASEINTLDVGISASVVQYGTADYRLQIVADDTGTENDFAVDSDGTVDLEVTSKVTAQDSRIYVNSGDDNINFITRSSNTISDVISGVTLNLAAEDDDGGTITTVTVERDTTDLKDKIQSFVDAFNETMSYLNEQFTYNEEQERAGVLSGETSARKVKEDLLSFATKKVTGSTSSYDSFSVIGLEINREGLLEINDEKLDEALTDNLSEVEGIFKDQGSAAHSEISYVGYTDETVAGSYAVVITQAATQAVTADSGTDIQDLLQDETLTITYRNTEYTVEVSTGDDSDDVVNKINTQLNAENDDVPVTASVTGGRLFITADEYGSDHEIKIRSSVAAGAGTTGIGIFDLTGDGLNVDGTVNGQEAEGTGLLLEVTGDGDAKGLKLTASTISGGTGDKGSISFTRGVGEELRAQMYELSFPYTGLIAVTIDSFDSKLENISDQIKTINRKLAAEQEILIIQFTKANEALGNLEYLKSTLSQ